MYTSRDAPAGLRSEQAYADVKYRLLLGEFPLNVRLGEERLGAIVGVSRTPVREALHRLHAEGLVKRAVDGGFEPVAPDVESMHHLYEVRSMLELTALRRPEVSGRPHDRTILEGLEEDWRALLDDEPEPSPSFVLLDEAFHLTLAEAAGNPPLTDLLRQVNERIRVVRMQDFLTTERITATVEEHLGIVGAVLADDLALAQERFLAHLALSAAVVEARVTTAVARMLTGGAQ